jgi:hypothetical protein
MSTDINSTFTQSSTLDSSFSKDGLEAEWFWFRIAYQERGAPHAHSCLRLKDHPGLSDLAFQVLDGRIAEKKLKDTFRHLNGEGFSENAVAFDLWQPLTVEANADPATKPINANEIGPLMEVMRKGVAAHNQPPVQRLSHFNLE